MIANRFEVNFAEKQEVLGSGAFGQVVKAYDREEKRHVAVKFEPVDAKYP